MKIRIYFAKKIDVLYSRDVFKLYLKLATKISYII